VFFVKFLNRQALLKEFFDGYYGYVYPKSLLERVGFNNNSHGRCCHLYTVEPSFELPMCS